MRYAFSQLSHGRLGPVLLEIPGDVGTEEYTSPQIDYQPVQRRVSAGSTEDVRDLVKALLSASNPVINAGQGVMYAEATDELVRFAELTNIPVTTTLAGKSAFPEDHPLSLGSAGVAMSLPLHEFLHKADVVFGIGCSFTETSFGVTMPIGPKIIHCTLEPTDLNKDVEADYALIGDAALTLDAVLDHVEKKLDGKPRDHSSVSQEIASLREKWLAKWMPKLTSDQSPLCPYRVIWDLGNTVDVANTIVTHDAGSPRDQTTPFWNSTTPLSYIGWGKTTQLGAGLGFAMGAKLAHPDKLCINIWGDAAIGFTGMDFETALRERIPILSILLNNFSMAIELKIMQVATEKYRSTDISGDYAAMARAFGGYGERVTEAQEIIPAIKRGIEQTQNGTPLSLIHN